MVQGWRHFDLRRLQPEVHSQDDTLPRVSPRTQHRRKSSEFHTENHFFSDELKDGVEYLIGSDISNLKAEEEDGPVASSSTTAAKDDEDEIVEISPASAAPTAPKRRMDEAAPEPDGDNAVAAKKRKVAEEMAAAADDVVCID